MSEPTALTTPQCHLPPSLHVVAVRHGHERAHRFDNPSVSLAALLTRCRPQQHPLNLEQHWEGSLWLEIL